MKNITSRLNKIEESLSPKPRYNEEGREIADIKAIEQDLQSVTPGSGVEAWLRAQLEAAKDKTYGEKTTEEIRIEAIRTMGSADREKFIRELMDSMTVSQKWKIFYEVNKYSNEKEKEDWKRKYGLGS